MRTQPLLGLKMRRGWLCLSAVHPHGLFWVCFPLEQMKEGDGDVCEEVHYIKSAFECGVPVEEVKSLLEIQKLLLEIKKLEKELKI